MTTPGRAPSAPAGTFTAVDGDRWMFSGSLTMDGAAAALAASRRLPLPASGVVDFAGLLQADSAALAVMIALKRRAVAEGRSLELLALPATLMSLAVVYGVEAIVGSGTTFG